MRNYFIVLKYTLLEQLRKKTFIITTIILILLTIGAFNINNIADLFTSKSNNNLNQEEQKIVIVDESNTYSNILNNYNIPETNIVFVDDDDEELDNLKEMVSNAEISGVVVIDETKEVPTFNYIVKDEHSMVDANVISSIIKNVYMQETLKKFNVDDLTLNNINSQIIYNIENISGEKRNISAYILSIITSLLLYFAVYFYGYAVSSSISNEKTSRVMETLITSTKPSTIVLGKATAMGILGLSQLLLLIITALISYKVFVGGNLVIAGETVDFSSITLPMILILILYFLLGYTLYAMINAVTGATVSKAEDLYSASAPVSFISLLSFYLGYFSLTNPTSSINVFASIMPFSSSFTMPSRMIMMDVPIEQIIISIIVLITTIILLLFVSVRMYSIGILHYGSKLSIKDLFKMSRK